ncbi:MAG: phosphatidylglycerophosphatase A [Candidatus Binatia bacterium]|nr:MAG: phosphatidylglycerophosphatase A [Candidatus Binatia bacterium]
MNFLVRVFASVFFVGYMPVAPGTFGSAAAIPLSILQAALATAHPWAALAVFAAFVAVASGIAGRAEAVFGQKDSSRIVIDEVAGYLTATLFLPPSWEVLAVAFVLFRFFDVVKPFPAARIDRGLGGGLGVVLDDVVAGMYTQVCLRVLLALGWL